ISDLQRGDPDAIEVIRTSESTGTPIQTRLTRSALQASSTATADCRGGQGQWLLALGTQYVAGLAVVSRSVQDSTKPVVIDPGFSPAEFVAATHQLDHDFTAVSLVPTQLTRLLNDDAAIAALQSYSAILLVGAAIPEHLHQAVEHYNLAAHTT